MGLDANQFQLDDLVELTVQAGGNFSGEILGRQVQVRELLIRTRVAIENVGIWNSVNVGHHQFAADRRLALLPIVSQVLVTLGRNPDATPTATSSAARSARMQGSSSTTST